MSYDSRKHAIRVLIVAEHASVRFGGEASLPYHYFRVLRARGADAWLVVHERTRAELEALFPEDLDRLVFVPDMLLQKVFYRASLLLPRRIAEATFGLGNQLLTQWRQRGIVRSLATRQTVVHQPIPVSPRFPSLLFGVDVPVVIGPMNGGMDYPAAFRREEPLVVRTLIGLGRRMSALVHRVLPGKRDADVLLVANPRTREALPFAPKGQVIQLVENGVDLQRWTITSEQPSHGNRFLFMGRLVDWKALDIVLHAIKAVPDATLDVVGDGPMREPWERLAQQLGLIERVLFHGWKSQEVCCQLLRGSVALVLPSLYECGGAVVLEAMSAGRPVIATAWGGPADYLDESCGILVPPTSRESMAENFAHAMQRLLQSPELCHSMGGAGRARIEAEYDWEKKVDTVQAIYRSAAEIHRDAADWKQVSRTHAISADLLSLPAHSDQQALPAGSGPKARNRTALAAGPGELHANALSAEGAAQEVPVIPEADDAAPEFAHFGERTV